MKKLILAFIITLSGTTAIASDFLNDAFEVSIVSSVVSDFWVDVSVTSEYTTEEQRKEVAVKIQNEIQSYSQTGVLSLYLAEKVNVVKSIDADLSQEEAIDILVLATIKIIQ